MGRKAMKCAARADLLQGLPPSPAITVITAFVIGGTEPAGRRPRRTRVAVARGTKTATKGTIPRVSKMIVKSIAIARAILIALVIIFSVTARTMTVHADMGLSIMIIRDGGKQETRVRKEPSMRMV